MTKCNCLLLAWAVASSALASSYAPEGAIDLRDADAKRLLSGEQLTWVSSDQRPPIPAWPDVFSLNYHIYVEKYGPSFNSTGTIYYHWPSKTFRADYIDWCLPLSGSGKIQNDFSCSFLATEGSMYFVNHTAEKWEDNKCCLFEKGLAATPPDWMKADQYNGTATIRGLDCDVWWFPGTSNPEKPCYGYWNVRDEARTPLRFYGLSSVGSTILDYFDFRKGMIPKDIALGLPNTACQKECVPSKNGNLQAWPGWPHC